MNWLPIAGAALDGTVYDLWVTWPDGEVGRITNCRYFEGDWFRELGKIYATITHYCEITPPQEPLSWPTESGDWWVMIGSIPNDKPSCFEITVSEDTLYFHDTGKYQKKEEVLFMELRFIRSTPPSFGDAP